jgi:hypothetical protein
MKRLCTVLLPPLRPAELLGETMANAISGVVDTLRGQAREISRTEGRVYVHVQHVVGDGEPRPDLVDLERYGTTVIVSCFERLGIIRRDQIFGISHTLFPSVDGRPVTRVSLYVPIGDEASPADGPLVAVVV